MVAKRVLIFSFVYYPRFIGGAEIAIKEITDRISDIEFDLICLRLNNKLPKVEKVGNVTVYRIGWTASTDASPDSLPWYLHIAKYMYPFLACAKATNLHLKNPYNALWSMMANYSGFAALFFKVIHMHVPFILSLQEGDPFDYIKQRTRFVAPIFKRIFTYADHIQTISTYLASFAKDMGATCPITVIPNGVDIKHFTQNYADGFLEKLAGTLGKKEGDVFLVTTSRLVVKNAVSDIISALTYLPKNVKLLVIGTGYELNKLQNQVRQHALEARVQFLGFIPHTDMPAYLNISDVFIRPSISEGFGNSFIEAMACRLPVIATAVGGITDFLVDRETGIVCEVNNPQSIALGVETYMREPELQARIVNNAYSMVLQRYDWQLVSKDMRDKVFAILSV